MEELRKYIEALKVVRDMTGTLPENAPEMLEEIADRLEQAWKDSQPIY
jgi:hypothetical protein